MDEAHKPNFNSNIVALDCSLTRDEREVKNLTALALCHKDRTDIAAEISTLSGREVTKRMLDDWASPGKPNFRLPASLVKSFCIATNSLDLALALLPDELLRLIQIGRNTLAADDHMRKALELVTFSKESQPEKSKNRKNR